MILWSNPGSSCTVGLILLVKFYKARTTNYQYLSMSWTSLTSLITKKNDLSQVFRTFQSFYLRFITLYITFTLEDNYLLQIISEIFSKIENVSNNTVEREPVDSSGTNYDRSRILAVSRVFRCAARYLECNFTLVGKRRRVEKCRLEERERKREERRNVRLKSSAFTSRTSRPKEKEFLRSSLNRAAGNKFESEVTSKLGTSPWQFSTVC